ncbi:hypothetical protein ILUMI_18563, partial [Ignelater luminosus]
VIFQAYKFASNEYRLFPMRFQVNACDAIKHNMGGLHTGTRCGNFTGCPFLKDIPTHVCNWSPDESKLPPFIPSGEYMIEAQAVFRNTEIFVVRAYGDIYRPITK